MLVWITEDCVLGKGFVVMGAMDLVALVHMPVVLRDGIKGVGYHSLPPRFTVFLHHPGIQLTILSPQPLFILQTGCYFVVQLV